jgi:hypothetical protein
MRPAVTIAPHFHLAGAWADRLLIADGVNWRAPQDAELADLAPEATPEHLASCACLFSVPAHLRSSFWAMLEKQGSADDGDFVGFSAEVARFLAFKMMPAPEGAVFELVLRMPGGEFNSGGLWAIMNLGDEPALLAWPELRLRLGPGEGCRVPDGWPTDVVPPENGEAGVLLLVRNRC